MPPLCPKSDTIPDWIGRDAAYVLGYPLWLVPQEATSPTLFGAICHFVDCSGLSLNVPVR